MLHQTAVNCCWTDQRRATTGCIHSHRSQNTTFVPLDKFTAVDQLQTPPPPNIWSVKRPTLSATSPCSESAESGLRTHSTHLGSSLILSFDLCVSLKVFSPSQFPSTNLYICLTCRRHACNMLCLARTSQVDRPNNQTVISANHKVPYCTTFSTPRSLLPP